MIWNESEQLMRFLSDMHLQMIHLDHMAELMPWYNMAPSLSSGTERLWQTHPHLAVSVSMTTARQHHATHTTLWLLKRSWQPFLQNELSIYLLWGLCTLGHNNKGTGPIFRYVSKWHWETENTHISLHPHYYTEFLCGQVSLQK